MSIDFERAETQNYGLAPSAFSNQIIFTSIFFFAQIIAVLLL